jgi:hypothetical protein
MVGSETPDCWVNSFCSHRKSSFSNVPAADLDRAANFARNDKALGHARSLQGGLRRLGLLGITLDMLPGHERYLRADPVKVAEWQRRLSGLDGLKVGIVWAGNPTTPADKRRSITPRHFGTLADAPGVCFVSLQKFGYPALVRSPRRGW